LNTEILVSPSPDDPIKQRVIEYYTATTPDYAAWSPGLNLHCGYWRWGINPFDREAMLTELSRQVLLRLNLPSDGSACLADLGGGTGATARTAVEAYPGLTVDVITLVPLHIETGQRLNRRVSRGAAIRMCLADYASTGLDSECYDAVTLIESACHAEGSTKQAVLDEAYRLLKPGGRLVLAEAMLTGELRQQTLIQRGVGWIYRQWCLAWAVPEMCRADQMATALTASGFTDCKIEDWSWRVAPSIAHIPLFATLFTLYALLDARPLTRWRWRHIRASFLSLLLGLCRRSFAYVAVVARKPHPTDIPPD
jgi:SAM-dependent methyltransferase